MRIVVPIVAGIGNALLAVPMVRQLKRGRPDARITILARIEPMAEIFRRLSEVDEVLVTGGGLKGNGRSVRSGRARHADVYLVPFPSNRWQYSLLAFTSGAKRRVLHAYPVGYWRALHVLPSTRVPSQGGIHDVVQNLNLLRELGIEPDVSEAPTFRVNDGDRTKADELLSLASIAKDANAPCYVSLEANMACGFGICVACVVEVCEGSFAPPFKYQKVCTEGPVFPAEAIVW